MKPKSIGIVGGAGPLAGSALLERVFSLSMSAYGCYRDADFPKVTLLSYPFTEMLGANVDFNQVQKEIVECLDTLRNSGAEVLAIACNTLHVFLPDDAAIDLVHLPKTVVDALGDDERPLVLCTSTSARFKLHSRFFPCDYPSLKTQGEVDDVIDKILKGIPPSVFIDPFIAMLKEEPGSTIVLGCTELSLLRDVLSATGKKIVDPLEITANKLLETSFNTIRRSS